MPTKKSKKKVVAKPKVKIKAKAPVKVKAKVKVKRPLKPRTDIPPSSLLPPDMPDTRPTRSITSPVQPQAATTTVGQPDDSSKTVLPTPTATRPVVKPGNGTPTGRRLQGAMCTWIGRESQAVVIPDDDTLLCPHCEEHLIESTQDDYLLWAGIDQFELGAYTSVNPPPRPHPGYRAFIEWVMAKSDTGMCWPTFQSAADAYEHETGKKVDPGR